VPDTLSEEDETIVAESGKPLAEAYAGGTPSLQGIAETEI
jgi:hypothetical protein